MFAYYYLGDVRNATNHAQEEFSGFVSIMEASDISERMNLITHSVDYFIHCYDKVLTLLDKPKDGKEILEIETSDLIEYTNTLRRNERDRRNEPEKDRRSESQSETNSQKPKTTTRKRNNTKK